MAGSLSDEMHRNVRRLFTLGAVGTMSDSQLLDQVASRRDEAAEAAFEELVTRHGPMVLRVCRGVLHDAHAAEDAFQAVFLVLASRARSIRRGGSVASWLFGVARRVAARGRRTAVRRRSFEKRVGERAAESYLPAEDDPDREILHEEIDGLPERLRTPVVLCYLEGLTYEEAADRLGLSAVAIRGRLARAREQLRRRLIRRGVTVPAGLLVAGAACEAEAAVPATLIHSTIRVALGFMAGNAAATLARGVLNSMLLAQLRTAAVLLCLGVGGSYWLWRAVASQGEGAGRSNIGRPASNPIAESEVPRTDHYGDPLPPGAAMRLGTVRFRQPRSLCHIVYSPDSRLVVTDSQQKDLQVWDARDGKKLRQIEVGFDQVRDFAFSPDGKLIAVVGIKFELEPNRATSQLSFLDVATGRSVRQASWDLRSGEEDLVYAPDGKMVATASEDGTLRLWDAATAKLLHQEPASDRTQSPSIAFSPDAASHLLAISSGRVIRVWDTAKFREVRKIAIEGQQTATGIAFSPDGSALAGGIDIAGAEIRLWRVGDGTLLRRFKSTKRTSVTHVWFSPDGKLLAAEGIKDLPVLFAVASGKELESFGREFDLVADAFSSDSPMAFSSDGKTLASVGSREALHFWDLESGRDRLAASEAHLGQLRSLTCLPDGKTLVSGSTDRTARIWDLTTGRQKSVLPHGGWVDSLSVSADGSILVTGSCYPELASVRVWNAVTGEQRRAWSLEAMKAQPQLLRGAAMSGDGSSVFAVMNNGALRCWDLTTGQERPVIQLDLKKLPQIGPAAAAAPGDAAVNVDRAVFSRDARSVAIIGNGYAQVVDVATGKRRFIHPSGLHGPCEFTPGGGSLAVVNRVARAEYAPEGNRGKNGSPTSRIAWLDSQSGDVRREIDIPDCHVGSMAFSPNGSEIAVGTWMTAPERGVIRIYRLRDKRELQSIASPCPYVGALTFTRDGKKIVAGMSDTSIVIWDVRQEDGRR